MGSTRRRGCLVEILYFGGNKMKHAQVIFLALMILVSTTALAGLVDQDEYTVGDVFTITLTNTLEEPITCHLPETLRIYRDVWPSPDPFGELVFMDESWGGTVLLPGEFLQLDYDTGATPDVAGDYFIWVNAGDFLWYDSYTLINVVEAESVSWDLVKSLYR